MKDDDEELARALFAAGALERAPAALRELLLRQVRQLPLPGPEPAVSLSRASRKHWRSWLWLPLAAAALPAIWLGWSVWGREPPAPQVSRERMVGRAVAQQAASPVLEAPSPASKPAEAADSVLSSRLQAPAQRSPDTPRPKSSRRGGLTPAVTAEPQVAAPSSSAAAIPEIRVGEQLDVLRRAREALRAGAPSQTLQLLAEAGPALEAGEFGAEARLLRIEALAGARRHAEARALARDFVRRYPHDPLVDRARQFALPEPK